eukprot:6236307-Pyramimonas_sp.AAC.3
MPRLSADALHPSAHEEEEEDKDDHHHNEREGEIKTRHARRTAANELDSPGSLVATSTPHDVHTALKVPDEQAAIRHEP